MKKSFYRICTMILIPLIAVFNCPINAVSNTAATIEIEHDGVSEVVAGQRITIEAEIIDESGVQTARVYFKAAENADYSFVPLHSTNEEDFTGILPAPANGVGTIEYLILFQNGNNQIFKTQTYMITVEDDDDAALKIAENEKIQVYTELEQAPAEISGFSDNIAIDVVESAAKLGVVAGLYSAAAGNSSSTAVAAGTITATTGGVSTTAIVVGSVLAAGAIGAAGAAAVSLAKDDDEEEELNSSTILGSWNVSGSHPRGSTTSGTLTFREGGTFTYNYTTGPGSGSWSLTGTNLYMRYARGAIYNGTASGNSKSFTMISSNNGWTLNFSR